jgi:phosphoribosylaminoimidazole-succinocarboxamide synthase
MINIKTLTLEEFMQLPLVVEGESKEVRYAGNGKVVIRFKPTIYSFTANRAGVIEGSDVLRLRASKIFLDVLKKSGIKHAYREVTDNWVLADLIIQPEVANTKPFRPTDLSPEEINLLPVAPAIEVIVKRMHSGTSKHRYFGMSDYLVRESHQFYANMKLENDGSYPEPIVRFDWRNPLLDDKGNRLADEILPDTVADWFIDTKKARTTALQLYDVLSVFLSTKDIVCYDLCLFIAEDGETVFGEISQDCGRFRHFDLGSLDKDVWRAGGSSEDVLQKWQLLLDMIQR